MRDEKQVKRVTEGQRQKKELQVNNQIGQLLEAGTANNIQP